ncbi:glycosyl hydrolase family 17 [Robertkochia marina]|uniref:Endo-1,3-beta-glucanase btgC n=2 Tax=Robertkochia marina TaxID=1227945 RepID=A0A4S3M270_9FLAO|nr:glycosyl hydrolase family 17 protein [Robertkochia marina]THD69156.1 glycosyl hydrolase family 17 [Robertkochia marina]TRZ47676.1 glycosyl hydrolase family 17 [Robertkochia marina]
MKNLNLLGKGIFTLLILFFAACKDQGGEKMTNKGKTAALLLQDTSTMAISYGGYRKGSRDDQPSLEELKEDMLILSAMGVNMIRTYNVHFPHAANVLQAIKELRDEDPEFEMYVMLGIWIDCKDAWTDHPDHESEALDKNTGEVEKAVALSKKYPEIVKILAVGNEAMVHWATSYFVQPGVILKWVNHLQELKKEGQLSQDLWITSSDNFASWGGGDASYHKEELEALARAVDYISVHTYPFHDTHYNPEFWNEAIDTSAALSQEEQLERSMKAAADYAKIQHQNVLDYLEEIGVSKPVHIGETGWASSTDGFYGQEGSKAADEVKQALYYRNIRAWSKAQNIACFYFEAFDEIWKDAANPMGSENHFGLFTVDGKAKYVLWDEVDRGVFKGLSRNGNPIEKTFEGDREALMQEVYLPELTKTDANEQ